MGNQVAVANSFPLYPCKLLGVNIESQNLEFCLFIHVSTIVKNHFLYFGTLVIIFEQNSVDC
jgi:hypothetical protein